MYVSNKARSEIQTRMSWHNNPLPGIEEVMEDFVELVLDRMYHTAAAVPLSVSGLRPREGSSLAALSSHH